MNELLDKTLLVVTPDYPDYFDQYLGSLYVKDQVENIRHLFNKVIVIAPVLRTFSIVDNDRYCFDYQNKNVEVYFPRCYFMPRAVPVVGKRLNMHMDYREQAVMGCIRDNRLKFDLVHAQFTIPGGRCADVIRNELGVPYVLTVNEDSGWVDDMIRAGHPKITETWKHASALIAINRRDAQKLSYYNTTYTIPYGYARKYTPMEKEISRKMLGLPLDKTMLFTMGIFQRRKGYEYLIDAMKLIRKEREDVVCYIAGQAGIEQSYEKVIRKKVEKEGLQDAICFPGFINAYASPIWMNACDLYVLSSLEEGFGITQIEAMACGKPVIATATAGSRDIVASEEVGLLCDKENAVDLYRAIQIGLNRFWDREKITAYARRYSWDTVSHQLAGVYRKVLEAKT